MAGLCPPGSRRTQGCSLTALYVVGSGLVVLVYSGAGAMGL